jgi:hypothetical protein
MRLRSQSFDYGGTHFIPLLAFLSSCIRIRMASVNTVTIRSVKQHVSIPIIELAPGLATVDPNLTQTVSRVFSR